MNDFYKLVDEKKIKILSAASNQVGLPAAVVEKDLWVTSILQMLFNTDLGCDMIFKGGTSLSKAWKLVERFSEDIDISVNPKVFGVEGDLTKKQLKNCGKHRRFLLKMFWLKKSATPYQRIIYLIF